MTTHRLAVVLKQVWREGDHILPVYVHVFRARHRPSYHFELRSRSLFDITVFTQQDIATEGLEHDWAHFIGETHDIVLEASEEEAAIDEALARVAAKMTEIGAELLDGYPRE